MVHENGFLSLAVNFLKSYLSMQGVATLVYWKVKIVARVFSASEINLQIVFSSAKQGSQNKCLLSAKAKWKLNLSRQREIFFFNKKLTRKY